MGRKAKVFTDEQLDNFKRLCSMMATRDEICQFFGCDKKTLDGIIDRQMKDDIDPDAAHVGFEAAFAKYSAAGRISLRRKQYELAMDGDKTMLIWLGKQWLGQHEPEREIKTTKETIKKNELTVFRANSPVVKKAASA